MLAIVFWSTTFALGRTLAEQLGPIRATCCIYLVGGVISCSVVYCRKDQRQQLKAFSHEYWWGCGASFVLYMLCLYLAIGLSSNRQQVVEVGLINYLWPSLTLAFSVHILRQNATPLLYPGLAVALAGVYLAMVNGNQLVWADVWNNIQGNGIPYILALLAAVSWALYCNLTRRWAKDQGSSGVPMFILVTGTVLLLVTLVFPEEGAWTSRAVLELLYTAIVPTFLAYVFWDAAVRKGDMVLVASLAHLTPLLATAISCFYLDVPTGVRLWGACGLVIGGAIVCKLSVREVVLD